MSQNDDIYRYQVTIEEYVYDVVEQMADFEDQLEAAESRQNEAEATKVNASQKALEAEIGRRSIAAGAKQKHKDVGRIVGSKHTLKMLTCLARFGTHFRHLPEMKASFIKVNMFNVYGGVSDPTIRTILMLSSHSD